MRMMKYFFPSISERRDASSHVNVDALKRTNGFVMGNLIDDSVGFG